MALSNRQLSEAALRIQERLKTLRFSRYGDLTTRVETLTASIEQLRNFGRRLHVCTNRKWLAAAREVTRRLAENLQWLARDISKIEEVTNRLEVSIPSLHDLVAELRQVENEFGQLRYDRKKQFLAVVTDPIELEGMHLGEFEIRLLLDSKSGPQDQEMYRVIALDPHPAGSDESVTHPHVQDECLCPGGAAAAIRSALTSGRICDFFLLVRSVLSQYNPTSAYVLLAKWDGISCYECGYTIANGGSYYCPSCENDVCDDCMSYCRCCEESYCQGCLTTCTACDEGVCSNCLTQCPDCQKAICQTCLKEGQCPCQQEKENSNGPDCTPVAEANDAAAIREPQTQTC